MSKVQSIKISDIVLDKRIYPRSGIDHKRVALFEENMRDGIKFDNHIKGFTSKNI